MVDSYGDVTAEYLALRRAAGLVEGARSVFWVKGVDAVSYLDGIVSQDLVAMEPGDVSRSLLLAPQGKLRALLWLLRSEQHVGIVVDDAAVAVARQDLERFRFRVDAEVGPPEPVLELWGPESEAVVVTALGEAPAGWSGLGPAVVARAPLGALPRFFVSGVDRNELVDAGATPAGALAATAVRIEAGEPIMGIDVDEATIPQESGLTEDAVSFTKGCYLGQELVARIDSRGKVNRSLRGLAIDRNVLPPPGAAITYQGRDVGLVSSVGESLELRAPIALGMVRREILNGQQVDVTWKGGSARATVAELPLDDFAPA